MQIIVYSLCGENQGWTVMCSCLSVCTCLSELGATPCKHINGQILTTTAAEDLQDRMWHGRAGAVNIIMH